MITKPIIVSDTTLRDGHQQPGLAFTLEERIYIAQMLRDVGVDIIEAGFPANAYDMEPVHMIAQQIRGPKISALARVVRADIDAAYQSLKPAVDRGDGMMHIFIGTSDMLLENSVRKSQGEVADIVGRMVSYAAERFEDVQFSPEDATRTPIEYLDSIIATAIQAGATRINIPDTVGYTLPMEFNGLLQHIIEAHPSIQSGQTILSVHCHNDLDGAVMNTLTGIDAGATQFEGTINGLGERAGNTDLFSVIMGLRTREDLYRKLVSPSGTSHIDSTQFTRIAAEVDRIAEMPTYDNRPITGTNAFRDSSGIHANAVMRNPGAYHIMDAEDVGAQVQIVIGPTSGTNIVQDLLTKNGYEEVSSDRVQELTEGLKGYSIEIKDALTETEALVYIRREMGDAEQKDPITLGAWDVSTGNEKPYANVELYVYDQHKKVSAEGVGPIDAATAAILDALNGDMKDKIKLLKFEEVPTSSGSDAQAHARIALEYQGKTYWGRAREPDIVKAGVNAVVEALNAIYILNNQTIGSIQTGYSAPEKT